MTFKTFEKFFEKATGFQPYPYQIRLAQEWGEILEVPTGCGKTEAIVLGWLWRRRYADEATRQRTPRRLAYTLPMRVLVEQTHERVRKWLRNLGLDNDVQVWILMGGEADDDWDIYPERDQILIGTQDMLLSRALNRGYAMSRYRWPVQFGLLNNDCQWVFDEVQLMGNGLATSAQLAAFREQFGVWGHCPSLWVSATFNNAWLRTVDFRPHVNALHEHRLSNADHRASAIRQRLDAKKAVTKSRAKAGETEKLAEAIIQKHQQGQLTLVILNTVARAVALYQTLKEQLAQGSVPRGGRRRSAQQSHASASGGPTELLLLHSRFRPQDRTAKLQRLKQMQDMGGIVVATQVVEAGVDISARVLFTELCPWPSFVQRVGRCNRYGEFEQAEVVWVDVDRKIAAPYELEALGAARKAIASLNEASPQQLGQASQQNDLFSLDYTHVIRAHDVYGFFSTEADLQHGYTDVSHFLRNAEAETDVQVFWRDFKLNSGPGIQLAPQREELCAVRLYRLREFLGAKGMGWIWNPETRRWERTASRDLRPGMTIMLATEQGGYSEELGWTGQRDDKPKAVLLQSERLPDGLQDESTSESASDKRPWVALADHLLDVEAEAKRLVREISATLSHDQYWQACAHSVVLSAWWHDVGKGTERWQKAGLDMLTKFAHRLDERARQQLSAQLNPPQAGALWAKFPDLRAVIKRAGLSRDNQIRLIPFLPGLRHEAASALLAWKKWRKGEKNWTALAVYLVACHHGKVRTVLRSIEFGAPNSSLEDVFGVGEDDVVSPIPGWLEQEAKPPLSPKALGAPGTWDGPEYVAEDAGGWVQMVAELLGPEPPDTHIAYVLTREDEPRVLGPFRLAYLEALIRAADVNASQYPGRLRTQ